ncbi:MAG TPA: hypothetical protein VGE12_07920 [Noviherbaspirillum sp.]
MQLVQNCPEYDESDLHCRADDEKYLKVGEESKTLLLSGLEDVQSRFARFPRRKLDLGWLTIRSIMANTFSLD